MVFRSVRFSRPAKGLAAFPDGGQPKDLYWDLSLYSVDLEQQKAHRLYKFRHPTRSHSHWYVQISYADSVLLYSLHQSVWRNKNIVNSGLGIYMINFRNGFQQKISDKGYGAVLSPDARQVAFMYKGHVFIYDIASEQLNDIRFPGNGEPAYLKWDKTTGRLCAFYREGNWEYSEAVGEFVPSDVSYEKNFGQDSIPYQKLKEIPDSVWGTYLIDNKLVIPE